MLLPLTAGIVVPWQFCDDMRCERLFADDCPGIAKCPHVRRSIDIFATTVSGGEVYAGTLRQRRRTH